MNLNSLVNTSLSEADGVFTLKNENTTLGFVRFNDDGEVEYIFVNPLFRKKKYSQKAFKISTRKNSKKNHFSKTHKPSWTQIIKIY